MKNICTLVLIMFSAAVVAQSPISESSLLSNGQVHSSARSSVFSTPSIQGMASVPVASVGGGTSYMITAGEATVQSNQSQLSSYIAMPFTNQNPTLRRIVYDNDDDDDWGYGGGGTGANTGDPMKDQFNPIGEGTYILTVLVFITMLVRLVRIRRKCVRSASDLRF